MNPYNSKGFVETLYYRTFLPLRPTDELDYRPLSAICEYLFSIFSASLHIWIHLLYPQTNVVPFSYKIEHS